jgi:hypothetical protein
MQRVACLPIEIQVLLFFLSYTYLSVSLNSDGVIDKFLQGPLNCFEPGDGASVQVALVNQEAHGGVVVSYRISKHR